MNKLEEIFRPTLHFIGSFDTLPSTANLGDVCMVDGTEYVYVVDWKEISFPMERKSDTIKIKDQTLYLT